MTRSHSCLVIRIWGFDFTRRWHRMSTGLLHDNSVTNLQDSLAWSRLYSRVATRVYSSIHRPTSRTPKYSWTSDRQIEITIWFKSWLKHNGDVILLLEYLIWKRVILCGFHLNLSLLGLRFAQITSFGKLPWIILKYFNNFTGRRIICLRLWSNDCMHGVFVCYFSCFCVIIVWWTVFSPSATFRIFLKLSIWLKSWFKFDLKFGIKI